MVGRPLDPLLASIDQRGCVGRYNGRVAPRISVVIPTYNRPDMLREAVESVLAQTVAADLEVIVVDDASPEPVGAFADPRVRVVRRAENAGVYAAMNAGVDAAAGEIVAFVDDDDWWRPEHLEGLLPGLERAQLSIGWSRFHDEHDGQRRVLAGNVHDVIVDEITPSFGALALRRTDWLPFDERYTATGDVEWWLRAARTMTVATNPAFTHIVRRHHGPRGSAGVAARIEGSLRMLDEHADYFAAHPRARAFRWFRIGILHRAAGDNSAARRAFGRSFRTRPRPLVAAHWLRCALRR